MRKPRPRCGAEVVATEAAVAGRMRGLPPGIPESVEPPREGGPTPSVKEVSSEHRNQFTTTRRRRQEGELPAPAGRSLRGKILVGGVEAGKRAESPPGLRAAGEHRGEACPMTKLILAEIRARAETLRMIAVRLRAQADGLEDEARVCEQWVREMVAKGDDPKEEERNGRETD